MIVWTGDSSLRFRIIQAATSRLSNFETLLTTCTALMLAQHDACAPLLQTSLILLLCVPTLCLTLCKGLFFLSFFLLQPSLLIPFLSFAIARCLSIFCFCAFRRISRALSARCCFFKVMYFIVRARSSLEGVRHARNTNVPLTFALEPGFGCSFTLRAPSLSFEAYPDWLKFPHLSYGSSFTLKRTSPIKSSPLAKS